MTQLARNNLLSIKLILILILILILADKRRNRMIDYWRTIFFFSFGPRIMSLTVELRFERSKSVGRGNFYLITLTLAS